MKKKKIILKMIREIKKGVKNKAVLSQEVIDRVAARVENDIILVSDVHALGRYQLFIDGKSESDAQILDRLIDQWIVRGEANAARYPQPSDEEVQRSLARLKRSFSSPAEFEGPQAAERAQQRSIAGDGEVAALPEQLPGHKVSTLDPGRRKRCGRVLQGAGGAEGGSAEPDAAGS